MFVCRYVTFTHAYIFLACKNKYLHTHMKTCIGLFWDYNYDIPKQFPPGSLGGRRNVSLVLGELDRRINATKVCVCVCVCICVCVCVCMYVCVCVCV